MQFIFFLVLFGVAAWFLWSSWDKETGSFDFKKGAAGLLAAGAGIWAWFTNFGGFGSGTPGM
jgi:hypothetical protein